MPRPTHPRTGSGTEVATPLLILQDKQGHHGTSTYTACLLLGGRSPVLPRSWTSPAAASVMSYGAGLCNTLTFRTFDTAQDRQELTVTQLQAPHTMSEAWGVLNPKDFTGGLK